LRSDAENGGEAGFTVIELIVSLALLGLVLTAIPSTLQLARQAYAVSDRLEGRAALYAAMRQLEAMLSAAEPATTRTADGAVAVLFEGNATSLQLVAPVPSGTAISTRPERVLIEVRPGAAGTGALGDRNKSGRELVLVREQQASGRARAETLVASVGAVSFRYFGPFSDDPGRAEAGWLPTWSGRQRLPHLIEATVFLAADGGGHRAVVSVAPRQRRMR
jgi:general secretion pathway protein J